MRVLLIHPEDDLPRQSSTPQFDLVIDLARAPKATYERWSHEKRCRVKSIYDFADPLGDLARVNPILQNVSGALIDEYGIDWWSMASYLVADGILASMMLTRLAGEINKPAELFCSRPDRRAEVLQMLLGSSLANLPAADGAVWRSVQHYRRALSRLEGSQIAQVIQDKWDPQHRVRRRFGHRLRDAGSPVILLPTAYINISRTAIAYARLLPDQEFLLVYARNSGRVVDLPPNVKSVPLHPYYPKMAARDIPHMLERWAHLKSELTSGSDEMRQAERLGAMEGIPGFIARGIAARDAWSQVFERHNFSGCLSADNTNIYTRVPLAIAERRGVSAVACHHGALDYRMATKQPDGHTFLAKSEMERDYLETVCHFPVERIVVGGPSAPGLDPRIAHVVEAVQPWLVFFTEPYEVEGWRIDEVYRDLLPRLLKLSRECGLRLVLKLHPFESIKEHRQLHARLLSPEERRGIKIMAGPLSSEDWNKIGCALTVQSSVAIECTLRKIPVFLCAWLQARCGGYVAQFAKFGVGRMVERPEGLAAVAGQIASYEFGGEAVRKNLDSAINPATLQSLLCDTDQQIRKEARTI